MSNSDILDRALNFYLQRTPLQLNDILGVSDQRMDTPHVVEMFRRTNKDVVAQVSNSDILDRALNFYLQCTPLQLNDILGVSDQKMASTILQPHRSRLGL